ncbi:MAG: methyltransferase type 11, partial [Burkholderiaceae bacterium]|nr:methyltransferase type 11 [Burkholderiaceae bacterium]
MSNAFYRAFEDRHRGPRELILARLRAYADLLARLGALYPAGAALDLGCGRGEWLELLAEAGFAAR